MKISAKKFITEITQFNLFCQLKKTEKGICCFCSDFYAWFTSTLPKYCYYIRRSVLIIKEYSHGINHEYKFKSLKNVIIMSWLYVYFFSYYIFCRSSLFCVSRTKKREQIFSSAIWLKDRVLKLDSGRSWKTFFQFCEVGDLMIIAKFGPLL